MKPTYLCKFKHTIDFFKDKNETELPIFGIIGVDIYYIVYSGSSYRIALVGKNKIEFNYGFSGPIKDFIPVRKVLKKIKKIIKETSKTITCANCIHKFQFQLTKQCFNKYET